MCIVPSELIVVTKISLVYSILWGGVIFGGGPKCAEKRGSKVHTKGKDRFERAHRV